LVYCASYSETKSWWSFALQTPLNNVCLTLTFFLVYVQVHSADMEATEAVTETTMAAETADAAATAANGSVTSTSVKWVTYGTSKYYSTLFPAQVVLRFLGGDKTFKLNALLSQHASTLAFAAQTSSNSGNEDEYVERWFSDTLGPEATAEDLRRRILEKHRPQVAGPTRSVWAGYGRVALHYTSETEKFFVVDLDLENFGEPFRNCSDASAPHPKPAIRCTRCWRQILAAGLLYASALQRILQAQWLKTTESLLPCMPLLTMSGNRGIHIWFHRSTKAQLLSAYARTNLVKAVAINWPQWVDPELHAAVLSAFATLDDDSRKNSNGSVSIVMWMHHLAIQGQVKAVLSPIDLDASTLLAPKSIRLPYSVHLASN
jgi:hypothetical protein